jgi:hypothetical protein
VDDLRALWRRCLNTIQGFENTCLFNMQQEEVWRFVSFGLKKAGCLNTIHGWRGIFNIPWLCSTYRDQNIQQALGGATFNMIPWDFYVTFRLRE